MSENLFTRRPPSELATELFRSCAWEEAGDPGGAAHKAAYYLFQELIERLGAGHAKYIFRHFGKLPTLTDVNDRENYALLDRFDRGEWDQESHKWRPISMLKLAKIVAKENEALPTQKKKGAGGTDAHALAKHIENLVKRRERELEAGTWFGPITHEQAIRHFGAQNVATSDEK
jgi:hypothetical protein